MGLPNIPVIGQDLATELAITQFVIPAGGGATFSNANSATLSAGGVCTITTNAAHGLTMTPTAPAPPNYFVTFGGSTSGLTGTGILVGNIFRILSIPTTTSFTIWSTISTATVTSMTVIPIFFPPFIAGVVAGPGSPTQTISSVVTYEPYPLLGLASFNANLGANCVVQYNPDNKAVALDIGTTAAAGTPATAPTWRTLIAASSADQAWGAYPWCAIWANGTTATSYISCHV